MLALLLTAGCSNSILPAGYADYPSIEHSNANPEYVEIADTFNFQDSEIKIKFFVDTVLYEDAKNTDKYVYLYQNLSEAEWSADYYRSFVENEYMDAVYDSILDSLRQVRDGMSLDDTEYAELISVYVQSIPYRTDEIITDPKYPVETVYEDSGDCDDKSILLAGLLTKEGYDVVLFEYTDDSHMNVGIKSNGCEYRNTGYASIEATDVNLIGWERLEIGDGIVLDSDPIVIDLNGGVKNFTACGEVRAIYNAYEGTSSECDSLNSQIEAKNAKLESIEDELTAMKNTLDNYMSSRDITGYNNYVPRYNSKVAEYENNYSEMERLVDRYNSCVEEHNRILERQYDRKGLYEYVQTV